MHEVSIMGDVFDILGGYIEEYSMTKVSKVALQIGEFSCVEEGALKFAFEAYSKDTIVENADLKFETIKATAFCETCSAPFEVSFTSKTCPACGTYSSNILTGYEMLLSEIEGE